MALVKYAQFQQCDAGDSFIAEAGGNDEYRLGSADDERVLDTGAEADIVGSEYGDRGEYPVRDNDILRKSQAEMLGFFAVCKGIVLQTKTLKLFSKRMKGGACPPPFSSLDLLIPLTRAQAPHG